VELTPRTLDDDDVTTEEGDSGGEPWWPRPRRRRSRWGPLVVLAIVLVGIGALVYRGLNDATLYFRNADEAVALRDDLGTKRFRLQGTVAGEPVSDGNEVAFDVEYNGVTVAVEHTGTPPDLFKPGIPVVVEGHWREGADVFDSDRMLIKHDATYESQDDYERRIDEAEQGGSEGASGDGGSSAGSGGTGSGNTGSGSSENSGSSEDAG
jgi:cytochrome c-type biogenesis protein CcmE